MPQGSGAVRPTNGLYLYLLLVLTTLYNEWNISLSQLTQYVSKIQCVVHNSKNNKASQI